MTPQKQAQYLALYYLDCLSNAKFSRLIKHFGSISAIAYANENAFHSVGLSKIEASGIKHTIQSETPADKAMQCFSWMKASQFHHLVCFEDDYYPPLLREIDSPPPLLFVIGDASALVKPQLAIVGSRNASRSGMQNAYWLAQELSRLGFGVCSGLAAGIDTQAHLGALSVKAPTIAIMGTGADRIYPAANKDLARQIQDRGALVTEFPLGSPPVASHFPQRNRIISGISLGVIVVEAAMKSGSLITARLAMEQNREVFAVPGSINNPFASGCHSLIREGARLIDSVDAINEEILSLAAYQHEVISCRAAIASIQSQQLARGKLDKPAKQMLALIGFDECHVDTLVHRSGLDIQTVSELLTGLEMEGLIEQQSGRIRQITGGLQQGSD